jgi:hypothetical protein
MDVVEVPETAGAGRVLAVDDSRSTRAEAHAPSATIATTTPTFEYVPRSSRGRRGPLRQAGEPSVELSVTADPQITPNPPTF